MTPMELSGSINVLGYALATLGPAIGVAWIFASVINGTARQPEARGAMMGTAYIGFAVVEALAADLDAGLLGQGGKQGRPGFDRLAEARGLDVVTFRDWTKIEAVEEARARSGAPREKFVHVEDMIKALDG